MFTLPEIEQRLKNYATRHPPIARSTRQAAVAVILRQRTRAPRRVGEPERVVDVLFIRRAEKAGDPWSGHMAFPGGHIETGDASLLAAAVRETREEIGLDLDAAATHIGALEYQHAQPRGRTLNMVIAPYVFRLHTEQAFRPNHEVAEVVWTPLAPIIAGANHTHEERIVGGAPVRFGGYRINGGHFVWGLTYRVMHSFFGALDANWRAPPQ